MPRGKKFDAAEKHFLKQKEVLDRTIRDLRQQLQAMTKDRDHFARRSQQLAEEVELLKRRNDELQKLHGLSDSDVKELLKKAESVNAVTGILRATSGLKPY